jgi:hypothetical protein
MTQQFDYLESRIKPRLEALSARVKSTEQPIISSIGFSKNDFFPLRANLSFLRNSIGDEVALAVDVKKCEVGFIIECDILKGEGQIIAEMPLLHIESNALTNETTSLIDQWVTNFDRFLVEKFDLLRSAVHDL